MQQAILTVDLGFGDAGKGSIVDYLARRHDAHTVVRYNGGAQAGHRVVTPGAAPQEHVFAQFGSGALAGAATHLSRFMLLDPLAMLVEAQHLCELGAPDPFAHTTIDAGALVITPFQRAANRLKELARGLRQAQSSRAGRHGSCGMGIGETQADFLSFGERVLFAGDLTKPAVLREKLEFLRAVNLAKAPAFPSDLAGSTLIAAEWEMLAAADWADWLLPAYADFTRRAQVVPSAHLHTILQQPGAVIFEGAQGVLLDEWRGFHPHTTWSTTTLANADRLLGEAGYGGRVVRLGITRAYATRHGAGPLVSEDAGLTAALPDAANGFGAWQRDFRVGWLDLVMLRYALDVARPLDALAVTCLDRLIGLPVLRVCDHYCGGGALIQRLTPAPGGRDLDYQAELTRLLMRCQPSLIPVDGAQALLSLVRADLGIPISLVSSGPTAADKQGMGEMW
ncbi:adenylosuccinate synthetase [Candidatus Amarolinea aalborgensis]|uniref:adenylosuccinate synthetase n=1 Tax=Candidatus Amarolinea aalborgensis TaxID=2249329 RepID=UPI003BF94629